MSDLLSSSLSEIPRFIGTAVKLVIAPKQTGIELFEKASEEQNNYRQAAVFFGVSLLLTELIRLPLLPSQAEVTKLLLLDGGWTTLSLLLFALLLFGVLRLFKSNLGHVEVIHLTAHYSGVFLVLVHAIQLGYFALRGAADAADAKLAKRDSPPIPTDLWSYATDTGSTELAEWFGAHLFVFFLVLVSYAFLAVFLIGLLFWLSRCWAAYASLSKFTISKTLVSLFVYLLLSMPILLVFILIRNLALVSFS